jgi:hypothetical protein
MDPLAQQLDRRMIRMSRRSWIIDLGPRSTKHVETLIHFSYQKEARIGRYLCPLKIDADGSVKIRPYYSFLFVTNCAHAAFSSSDEFTT